MGSCSAGGRKMGSISEQRIFMRDETRNVKMKLFTCKIRTH
jgi:hypothetical protein